MNSFIINQKLPSLNETLRYNRTNAYMGAKFKKDIEEVIGWSIKQALASKSLHRVDAPVIVKIEWHEKTKKRDVDNIQSSAKFILDALVNQGVLIDDSRKFVKQIYHEIIDDTSDYVKIELIEA